SLSLGATLRKVPARHTQRLPGARVDAKRVPLIRAACAAVEEQLILLPQFVGDPLINARQFGLFLNDEVGRACVTRDAGEAPRFEITDAESHPSRKDFVFHNW